MAETNFTAEQQQAIDTYNKQKQVGTEKGVWNTQMNTAALNQLKNAWVWLNANGFFSINWTQTATSGTTTKPTQQVSQNQNNGTVQTTVSNQNNTVQQQWALKPLSQDYYNQSNTDSQEKIVSNLNTYKQSNPEYFTDYDSFKRNFSYDARNDTQKQTLDTWYKGYQRGMELNSKAVSDIATQYKNWLVSDSDLEQLRTANQQKYGEVMNYINKQTILSKYDEESNVATSTNPFQSIIDQYTANMLSASQSNATSEMFENYKNQMNSPEMTELSDQLADKEGQIKEYQQELNRIKSDVEKRYEWTWASKSKINAIIADESYKIQELMNTANLEYNTLATKYNNRMSQYQNEFQLQLQEYEYNMKARNQQMQELWFVMDLMNFETNEQKDEREWNNYVRQYDYQYWNINSKDEASRRRAIENAVDSVLTEFSGITMMRSRDQMVEDIKNLVDGGMSLWEAITKNIREPIMQKPEYKVWKSQQYGNTVSVWWSSFTIDSNGNLVLSWWTATPTQYNWPQYTAATQQQFNTAYTQLQSLWDGSWWGQCGSFVNNYLQDMWIGRLYTDPIEAKKSVVNSTTPTIWSVAVIDWTNNPNASEAQKKYGHVWIVVWIDGNKITLKQSNKNWNETIFTSTYDASQIYGYFDPRMSIDQANANFASQSQSKAQSYNTQNPYSWSSWYTSNWTEINAGWWITSLEWKYREKRASNDERNSTLENYWITLKEYNEQKQRYADYLANTELADTLTKAKTQAEQLLKRNQENSGWKFGLHRWILDTATAENWSALWWAIITKAADWKSMYDYLIKNLTLDKFIDLKNNGATFGAMSEWEWKIISDSISELKWSSSNERFETVLEDLIDGYNKSLSKLWVDSTYTTTQTPDMSDMQNTNSNNTLHYTSNWTLVKYENWKALYSYDNWKTWH